MTEKSTIALNNYDKLKFLDPKYRSFLEEINVTNLIDRLSFTEEEIYHLVTLPDYDQFSPHDLFKVYRNRGI